jgi:putative heme-binding domain-containing protein
MITRRWFCAFVLVLAGAVAPRSLFAAQAADDIEQGRRLFDGMCVVCHGFEGAGGEGPSLNRPNVGGDDQALRSTIENGIPARGMPRVRRFTDNELGQLVAYVRSLGRTASAVVAGNVERGSQLYNKLGCASCHIIDGQGGSFGPVLTQIGNSRGPQYLRQALIDPETALPRGTLPIPARGFAEYLPVRVVTSEGREVRGVRVNEDTFTIQLRDAGNRFHSFRKSDLRQIEKEASKSFMPSYKDRLAPSDLDDLVAYLYSLRGGK